MPDVRSNLKSIYDILPDFQNTDFVIGIDNFENVLIDSASVNGFWYFKNTEKGLIKRFVLQQSPQIEKICVVTLIKKNDGKFTPRFDFQIWHTTKKAFEEFSKETIDQNLIKAKVDLDSCHDNFLLLLNFINSIETIDFGSTSYAVIEKSKKKVFDNVTKETAIRSFVEKYGPDISDQDISLLQNRRSKLEYFEKLLLKY